MTNEKEAPSAEEPLPPIGTPLEILNPDLCPPALHYMYDRHGGQMTAFVLADHRRAFLFAGLSSVWLGFDLITCTMQDLELLDAGTYAAIRARAQQVIALIDSLPAAGVVRDVKAMQ